MSLGYFAINQFRKENECFYHHQFSFKLNFFTSNAFMPIIEGIEAKVDNNEIAAGVSVDLKKAFDTVNHKIFIGKLEHHWVRGIEKDWFCSI